MGGQNDAFDWLVYKNYEHVYVSGVQLMYIDCTIKAAL